MAGHDTYNGIKKQVPLIVGLYLAATTTMHAGKKILKKLAFAGAIVAHSQDMYCECL